MFPASALVDLEIVQMGVWYMQLQQACLLAELLLAVLLQHFAETNGDPTALSRLGDNRVSFFTHCNHYGKQACLHH